jgi:PII-like signaling protein
MLSTDFPIVIEVIDRKEKIEAIKPVIDQAVKEG